MADHHWSGRLSQYLLRWTGSDHLRLTPDTNSDDFTPYERVSSGHSVIDADSVNEFGRTFTKYRDGRYMLPNDGVEQERLDIHHRAQMIMMDWNLYLAPIGKNTPPDEDPARQAAREQHPHVLDPPRVLDIATGTGIWANEFAEQHPRSQVIGTDFSMIQPSIRPNCTFVVEDAEEEEWTLGGKFNYIHMRLVATCFERPERVIENCYKNLEDGGWLEIQDPVMEVQSDDGTHEGTAQQKWLQLMTQGMASLGRDTHIARRWKELLEAVGFVDVRELRIPWVFGDWPADPKWKMAGRYVALGFDERAVEGTSLKMLKAAGLSNEEIRTILKGTVRDINDRRIHAYCPYHIVCGRKPHAFEREALRQAGPGAASGSGQS